MRFIGSKTLLLDHIRAVAEERGAGRPELGDIFQGNSKLWRDILNSGMRCIPDLLYFSYVPRGATIENDSIPEFDRLKEELGITDPVERS